MNLSRRRSGFDSGERFHNRILMSSACGHQPGIACFKIEGLALLTQVSRDRRLRSRRSRNLLSSVL